MFTGKLLERFGSDAAVIEYCKGKAMTADDLQHAYLNADRPVVSHGNTSYRRPTNPRLRTLGTFDEDGKHIPTPAHRWGGR